MKLQIIGMNCAACAARIEKSLKNLPGIRDATVNFALETATIQFGDTEFSGAEVIEKINQMGYQAIPSIRKNPIQFSIKKFS